MSDLSNKKCTPCEVGAIPLQPEEIKNMLKDLDEGWSSDDDKSIHKTFKFDDFMGAMNFANSIAKLAEEEGHHPTLTVSWGKLKASLMTHKIKGLHENDFILAAKIDKL
ncbi:4a-hydroxytetrahydrobiopterin dehydratase [Gudongella sp. SC589]|uniref:4a-hydroxytetrahydrobiopterin dehydratase n=1 Tax=Gudongella sp. SC589 TaxID=3385990 RepID=UPI0039046822